MLEKLTFIDTLLGGTDLLQITEAVHKVPLDVTLTPRAPGSPETFAGKHKETLLNNDNKGDSYNAKRKLIIFTVRKNLCQNVRKHQEL